MKEVYKDIQGYEGLYQISNLGNVKSLNYNHTGEEKVLRCGVDSGGYLFVGLCKNCKRKNFLIHRLVAEAFIPNTENKPCVDHINTIKNDNRSENLRWVTPEENMNNVLSKQKISIAKKGNQNAKGNKNMLGKKHSDKTKQKMSLLKKGKHWKLENGKRIWY